MIEFLKFTFAVFVQGWWLKNIDKECDKYNKIKRKLNCQQKIVNELLKRYEEIYGEDLRIQQKNLVGDENV